MIIDSLTHVTPDGRWFDTAYDASESRLLREMDSAGVERAVVVALAGYISNEYVLDACARNGSRWLAGASFDPAAYPTPEHAAREFRAQLHGAPFQVLKLHPRLNHYDPLDIRCLAVLDELSSWKQPLPVWLDTLFYFSGGQLQRPPLDSIHHLVCRFPGIVFVLLHGTGASMLSLAETVRDCPNAFVDLSLTLCRYARTSVMSDIGFLMSRFDRRTVCGSDFPEYVMSDVLAEFDRAGMDISAEKPRNVLGRNLQAILRIN